MPRRLPRPLPRPTHTTQLTAYTKFRTLPDDATFVRVGHDRRQLVAAPMVRLVKRQPPGRPSLGASHQFDRGAKREGAPDLVAGSSPRHARPRRARHPRSREQTGAAGTGALLAAATATPHAAP